MGVAVGGPAAPVGRPVVGLTWLARTAVLLTLLVAAAAMASLAAATTTAPEPDLGSIGIRLVDVPVSTADDPRARLYIVDHLAPGTVIERRIEVTNTTASTVHVELYPAAATIEAGKFLGSDGHTPNAVSTWTTVLPAAPDIPAGGRVIATVIVAVPADAVAGEQYAAVWAEARSAPDAGVTRVNRVGVRLYVSVGPGGEPLTDFTIDSLTAERSSDGRPMILAAVHNTGQRALDMAGTLELLTGPGGLSAGPFPATPGTTVAIGESEPVTIVLDEQLPAGPWDAQITLSSGLIERSARATVTFPEVGSAGPVPTSSMRPGWLYPAIAGVAILLLLALLLSVLLRRRRHRPVDHFNTPAPRGLEPHLTRAAPSPPAADGPRPAVELPEPTDVLAAPEVGPGSGPIAVVGRHRAPSTVDPQ